MSAELKTWPERIWLQHSEDGDIPNFSAVYGSRDEITWCQDKQFAGDVEYVRADRIAELEQECASLSRLNNEIDARLAELETALQQSKESVSALEQDLNEQCRLHGIGSEREAALMAKVEQLERQSVTQILLDIVPGEDGMGEERYAKSVNDVIDELTKFGEKNEELERQNAELRMRADLCDFILADVLSNYDPGSKTYCLEWDHRGKLSGECEEWPDKEDLLYAALQAGKEPKG